ncbi:DUF2742 domain-containing protein [Mycobacterium sp. SMC-19]|uniref:DUF2742 domain-containing protein n=1 Tax=Mycobacterium sp. SMC-19 TaxID=3381630 RepID=UPI0038763F67
MTSSRQVSWSEVNRFITEVIKAANCGPLPLAGSPEWRAMPDDSIEKLIALADAGQHAVLQWDITQTAAADASKAIAASENWHAVSRCIRAGRGPAYIPRRAS